MSTTTFGNWKLDLSRTLSRWNYAPVGDSSSDGQQQKSWLVPLRDWMTWKMLWRVVLVLAALLLLSSLFHPAVKSVIYDPGSASSESEAPSGPPQTHETDWSQYAYCQYVTNEAYLCNSVMIFESLTRLGAMADRLMMYPEDWVVGSNSHVGQLLAKARDEYGVNLVPIEVQHFTGERTWADSFTKLLAFNQTEYKRVLSLDSDATVLQPMDELFLLPPAPVAMPRAYWLDEFILSSQLLLVEPSKFEFDRILVAFESRSSNDFDMEIVNQLYGDSCFIIPHRRYDLLTGEFRSTDHHKYLGSKEEQWDPIKALDEAKFLHFSDWPYPKPWIPGGAAKTQELQPKCVDAPSGGQDCRNQEKWLWAYEDFRTRRQKVCGSSHARRQIEQRHAVDDSALPSRWEPIFT